MGARDPAIKLIACRFRETRDGRGAAPRRTNAWNFTTAEIFVW
jgi:hypothetical protein